MEIFYQIIEKLDQYPLLILFLKIIAVLLLAFISLHFSKKYVLRIIKTVVIKSKTQWDDILLENNTFSRLSNLIPPIIFYNFAYILPTAKELICRLSLSYMALIVILVADSFLSSINQIYNTYNFSKDKPIKGYIQTVKIVMYVLGFISISALLMGKSPLLMLSGIGAMSAVLLLVFKDTILSLVASIQLTYNNMVKIGDWITMPKYSADGDVIDIALHTIKIQNFDKTITSVPTHKLIDESFTNWRGMSECGGRRIKRSINIDITSIKFLDDQMMTTLKKIQLLQNYLEEKEKKITTYNKEKKINNDDNINKMQLTNIGVFRIYLENYLKSHPNISKEMTFLIRQLPSTEKGLPLEIYVFANDNNWVNYERIQADIFDHIFAVIPEFKLRIFQNPTGEDFKRLSTNS